MKKTEKKKFLMGILAITLVFGMTVVGCVDDPVDDPTNNNGVVPQTDGVFTSLLEFKNWLAVQSEGTDPANPLLVKLNISELYDEGVSVGLYDILNTATKYISLDLSGSTGITYLHEDNFYNCPTLVSVTLPASINKLMGCSYNVEYNGNLIGNAFNGCPILVSIKVDSGNTVFTSVDGVLFTKDMKFLISYPRAKTGAFTISDSVTTIGGAAFNNCASLTSVTFQGTISSDNFSSNNTFPGDLRTKYLAGGGIGTYKTNDPGYYAIWTRQ